MILLIIIIKIKTIIKVVVIIIIIIIGNNTKYILNDKNLPTVDITEENSTGVEEMALEVSTSVSNRN